MNTPLTPASPCTRHLHNGTKLFVYPSTATEGTLAQQKHSEAVLSSVGV